MSVSTILGPEHLAQIDEALAGLKQAKKELQLAKQAGLPVEDMETELNDTENRLLKIKSVYFPNG